MRVLGSESFATVLAAEVPPLPVNIEVQRRLARRDLHTAHWVDRHGRRGLARSARWRAVPLGDDLREDRQRDLLGRAPADGQPRRAVELGAELLGQV